MKVAQLLGLQGPDSSKCAGTGTASTAGLTALSEAFFEPLVAGNQKASLASLSLKLCPFKHLEGSLAWGPLCRSAHQALKGAPWVGSYPIVQCIRYLMSQSLYYAPSSGEGNGNPLQCSCLENPRDGGAWWAAVYGVTQSRTRLKRLSSSSSSSALVRVEREGGTTAWLVGTLAVPSVQGHGLPPPQELWPYKSLFLSLLYLAIRRPLWPVFL